MENIAKFLGKPQKVWNFLPAKISACIEKATIQKNITTISANSP